MKVYITRNNSDRLYHKRKDCDNFPDEWEEKDRQQVAGTYGECTTCFEHGGNVPDNPQEKPTCPFCGEVVGKLPPHLPCQGYASD
jgi:hypothetical protein